MIKRSPHGIALLLLAAAGTLLWAAGSRLASPPLDLSSVSTWVSEVGPPTAAIALLRLAGLALVAWLGAAVALDAFAAAARSARLTRIAGAALPAPMRVALHRGVGLTLALGAVAGPPAPAQPTEAGHVAVMTALPDGAVEWMQPVPDPGDGDPAGTASMRLLPAEAAGTTATMSQLPESVAPAPTVAPIPAPSARQVTVTAGDSLWRLAEDVVAERLGRAATDVEITPYWQSVVEANRSRLRSGDPDVLFPGESVVMP